MLHDMRYKGPRLSEIIRNIYHRDPLNGDIYMSRDRRTIRLFQYKHHVSMSKIRKLYKREDLYVEKGYDAEKIKEMRNDEYTRGIVDELLNEMFDLMANKMDKLPKLMQQALNYLHKFWKQVFAQGREIW